MATNKPKDPLVTLTPDAPAETPEVTETAPTEPAPAPEPAAVEVKTVYVPSVSKFPPPTESAELIKAVKADAEARGKEYHKCPVTGVLVVC